MSNISSMSRESKKRQLRRQIVPSSPGPAGPGGRRDEEDSHEVVQKAHRKVVQRRLKILLVFLIMAAIGTAVVYQFSQYHQYEGYQVSWEKSLTSQTEGQTDSSFCGYEAFGGGILRYTRDGMSFLDYRGNTIWNQSYEMKSPIVSVNGNYAVVADRQGTGIYICNPDGCQGQAASLLPIMGATVSAGGVAAVMGGDSSASYVFMYRNDGSQLQISIKSLLENDGYPIDISLSPSGNQLAASFLYLEQGLLKCKIVFYNFGVGQSRADRVVGIIFPEDLSNALVARIRFLDEDHVAAFSDQGVFFISTRVETEPTPGEPALLEEEIRSICYSPEYVGVVTNTTEGEDPYRLLVYRSSGRTEVDQTFDFPYTDFRIDGDTIFLYNDDSCQIYNMKGTLKFSGTFDFTISGILKGRIPGNFLVLGPQSLREIRLN